jgi:hypothetical protein
MKHQDISKLCADTLRSFFIHKYGTKLKAGHAHEIVAAFFGFKSRIAMLSEKGSVLTNWGEVGFVLQAPPVALIEDRLRDLLGSPSELPSFKDLTEAIYSVLVAQLYVQRRLSKFFFSGFPSIKWEMDVSTEHRDSGTRLTVVVGYRSDTHGYLRDSQITIHLPRALGSFDYDVPEVRETRYSGLASTHSDEELERMYPTHLHQVRGRL